MGSRNHLAAAHDDHPPFDPKKHLQMQVLFPPNAAANSWDKPACFQPQFFRWIISNNRNSVCDPHYRFMTLEPSL
jgi:hypothetical protein